MTDVTFILHDVESGNDYPVKLHDNQDGTYSQTINTAGGSTTVGDITVADGGDETLGAKADAKSTSTTTTPATIMSVLKQISYMEQNPASRAVTGLFALETGGNLAAILAKLSADPATQTTLAALLAKIPAVGQALAAASTPVVLPATQITTLTPPAAITNFANETGGNLAGIKALLPTALAAHGGLVVEGVASGVAIPVSGTFYQSTQPASDAGPAWTSIHGVSGVPFTSADQHAGLAAVTDAPTAGLKLVVTDIFISSDTAMSVTFKEETAGNAVVTGPIYIAANSSVQVTPRSKMWKLSTAAKKLEVITSVSGNIMIDCGYYYEA